MFERSNSISEEESEGVEVEEGVRIDPDRCHSVFKDKSDLPVQFTDSLV